MALSLAAATLLLAGTQVSAMPKSVEGICANKQNAAERLGQEFLSCGIGSCGSGTCSGGKKMIAWKTKVDGASKCNDECTETTGYNSKHNKPKDSAFASDSDSVKVPEKEASDSDSKDTATDSKDDAPAPSGDDDKKGDEDKPTTTDDADKKDGGDDVMGKEDGEKGDAEKTDGDDADKTDGDDADKSDGDDDGMVKEDGDDVMEDGDEAVAADAVEEGPTEDGDDEAAPVDPAVVESACATIVDALMGLELAQASALATIAAKALDPASIEVLLNPAANLTVFVPPEQDLLKLLGGVNEGTLTLETVGDILRLHVVTEYLPKDDLLEFDGETLPTLGDEADEVMVAVDGDSIAVIVGNSSLIVTQTDIDGCSDSQVIHFVDGLFMPEGLVLDLDALPEGDLGDVPALAPAQLEVTGDNGEETRDVGSAAGVVGAFAAVAVSALVVLAL